MQPPSWLSKEAQAEWRRVVPELDEIGVLKKVDRGALAAYCVAWARMVQADRDVQERGPVISTTNGQVRNPYVGVFRESARLVRQLARRLGLLS